MRKFWIRLYIINSIGKDLKAKRKKTRSKLQQWNATHSPGPCACSLNCLSVCVSGRFKIPFCSNSKCYFISLESIYDWSFRSHLGFDHGWNMTAYQMHILLRFLNEKTRIWHVVFRKQSRQSYEKYHNQLRSYKYKISSK